MTEQLIRSRMSELARAASLEISPREMSALANAKAHLRPGALVSITWMPGDADDRRANAARAVREAGFTPIPHLAARRIASQQDLRALLARLRDEAQVDTVFVIGGDRDAPRGPFASALDLIASGALQEAGIKSVGLAGYPEPHPAISPEMMVEAHQKKRELAASLGLSTFMMTQFSFDPDSLVDLLRARRAAGEVDTIRLGIAGPASVASLLKFAAICGVQTSARALTKQGGKIARMFVESGPEPLLRGLCEAADFDQLGAVGVHIFPFGGFVRSAEWLAGVAASAPVSKAS